MTPAVYDLDPHLRGRALSVTAKAQKIAIIGVTHVVKHQWCPSQLTIFSPSSGMTTVVSLVAFAGLFKTKVFAT